LQKIARIKQGGVGVAQAIEGLVARRLGEILTRHRECEYGRQYAFASIVDPGDYARWLDPAVEVAAEVRPLLRPFPALAMCAFPVSTRVNNPAFDDPACLAPA
jgi:hypothetical protein